jgi:predicted Zn-dependent protease with MMP-like domain
VKAHPPPAQQRLLEQVHQALDAGDDRRARHLLKKVASRKPHPAFAYARWRLKAGDEDLAAALKEAESAVQRWPEEPDLQHALGWTLAQHERFDEAIAHLEEACYLDADFADAWYDLALAREATGDRAGMRQAFAEVHELDRLEDLEPRFGEDQVMAWAEAALESLPGPIREAIAELPIFVQDLPDAWILDDAPWDPRLLGLFDGPTLAELRSGEVSGQAPHVYLFRKNLDRVCVDAREMAEQVRITLHHEVLHFLGLDEHEVDERGLA